MIDCKKFAAVGAVFVMIAVAFAGITFGSEESDADSVEDCKILGYAVKKGETVQVRGIYTAQQFTYGDYSFTAPTGITVSEISNSYNYVNVTASSSVATGEYQIILKRAVNGTEQTMTHTIWVNDYYSGNIHFNYSGSTGNSFSKSITATYSDFSVVKQLGYAGKMPPGISIDMDNDVLTLTGTPTASGLYCIAPSYMLSGSSGYKSITVGILINIADGTYDHTISYYLGEGRTGGKTVVTDSNSGSSSVTLASAPEKPGYTFKGWLVNGTTYAAGAIVSVPANSTVTAIAQWEEATTYTHTITYATGGGSSVSNTVVTDTNSGSSSVTLASAPTKSGYTFKGWLVNSTIYVAGKTVSVAANATVTATAQWSENKVTASASTLYGKTNASYSNQIAASATNGASLSYAVKSVTGGSATVNSSGLVTYKCPTVTATTTYGVTVTVTGTFSDGSTVSKDVVFDVIVDPILAFTNAVTSGSLSVKGAGA